MAVRHTNFANASLITTLLSATLLLMVGSPHFASAQETKPSQKAAKSTGSAKLIARGKYIVEGVAGCGYCHSPHDKNGDPDRTKWLAGGPVFYQPAQRVAGWPVTAPRLAGLPPGSDAEVITLLTTSISRSGRPLRAPMPRFLMTRSDAEAVVAYLRSLSSSR